MFRFVFALLCFTLPVHASTYTSFSMRYDTAPLFGYTFSGPGGPSPNAFQFLGGAASLEVLLQFEGLYDALPDGEFAIEPESEDFFHAEVSGPNGPFGAFEIMIQIAQGRITSWSGFAADLVDADGLHIDSDGVDTWRPFVHDSLQSIAAGSWTERSRVTMCFDTAGGGFEPVSCNAAPPNPTAVPLPAAVPVFVLGLLALAGLRGRKKGSKGWETG